MNWEIFLKAKNIDKHMDELKNFRNELSYTNLPTICLKGFDVKVELNSDDVKALTEFFDERISNLEKRFEEL